MANFPRRSRVAYEWGEIAVPVTMLTTTQALLGVFSFAGARTTIRRCRGNLLVTGIVDAALDSEIVGLGLIKVHDAAANAGGVSLPGPINDGNADWIWHQHVPLFSNAVTGASDVALGMFMRVPLDSKAMRTMNEDNVLALMGELTTGAMASVRVLGGLRVLVGH